MRVLVIKTSSMGDIIHTLPALTEAKAACPAIQFDWLVEKSFAQIPAWHPAVNRVIPIEFRKWRKQPIRSWRNGHWTAFCKQLRTQHYDLIIDAQGLLKSALFALLARGKRVGMSYHSAREPMASFCYQQRYQVKRGQHAIMRVRQLFAQALNYSLTTGMPDYGIAIDKIPLSPYRGEYLVFLHGTTWQTKEWPQSYWQQLAMLASQHQLEVLLPWGNAKERKRAEAIAAQTQVTVLPQSSIAELAGILARAKAVVGVDTGLGHLAAALSVPAIHLFGATDPSLTASLGKNQKVLSAAFSCAPCLQKTCSYQGPSEVVPACFQMLTPNKVWQALQIEANLECQSA